jgi:hypothetical protein
LISISAFIIGHLVGSIGAAKVLSIKLFHYLKETGSKSIDAFDFVKDFEKYILRKKIKHEQGNKRL